ncbi:MAG TPA: hypothetical protein VIM29_14080 [Bacillota bacterium]
MAVKDGGSSAYSQIKQGYVTKQAERAAADDFRKKNPEEQKQAARQADKTRTKSEWGSSLCCAD